MYTQSFMLGRADVMLDAVFALMVRHLSAVVCCAP